MPFVRRDARGAIVSLHRESTGPAAEFVSENDPEVRAFLGLPASEHADDFVRLDAGFVRVIEDIIDTLIVKNVINITDLPSEAQAKLFARKSFRDRVTRNSLRLFGDAGESRSLIDDTNFGALT